ncbi:MAG: hypothetical protein ACRD8U_00645 [Pyrinomonadaceae bacterium]
MTASTATSFKKTEACPSSKVLLSFRIEALSPEIIRLVEQHLANCHFCRAEIPLLAHYQKPRKGECRAPEMPINLRILAESLLTKNS